MSKYTPSDSLLAFLENEEGFKDKAYRNFEDEPWTVGHGLTYIDGRPVTEADTLTPEQSRAQMRNKLNVMSGLLQVKNKIPETVTPNQYDAVMSLVYNIGAEPFINSDTGREFFAGKDISHRLPQWKLRAGKPLQGLWQRRLRELDIYKNGNYRTDWTHSPEFAMMYPYTRSKKKQDE